MQVPDFQGASIVMIGSFNPTIFQPRWLGAQQLIRPEEAENATITVIQAEISDFSTEWFQLQVLQNRLQILCTDPRHYAPLRDLASAMLTILPHTPINALGLNRQFHFRMPSAGAWHGIGHLLAPKEPWNEILDNPGLRVVIMEGTRKKDSGGTVRVKIEPSSKVLPFGLYIEVNEEAKPPANDREPEGAQWVSDHLSKKWDSFIDFSEIAAEHLLAFVKT
jgi:hypothetical protein